MNSNKLPYFFLALAAVLSAAAVALLFIRPGSKPVIAPPVPGKVSPSEKAVEESEPIKGIEEPITPQTPEEIMKDLGVGLSTASPSELLEKIGKALEEGDLTSLSQLIGNKALDTAKLEQLRVLHENEPLRIGGIREIGEIEMNRRSRWAIDLADRETGRDRILFDLKRDEGKWSIDQLTLPPASDQEVPKDVLADSLGIAASFLDAVLDQNFEFALNFIDTEKVSEAKIAALCILFEEGQYQLRKQRPLRAMFSTDDTAGFIANVTTTDSDESAQFSLNLRRPEAGSDWKLIEINLDALLSAYADRYADGDVYYSPLVKNPAGGETLALYFEFDQDEMNVRTRRQIEIVASMLKADPAKKITLSGHTDALGSENYNDQLSSNRAQTVRDFLAAAGVSSEQIITLAKGASQPRRPNVTEDGEDDPNGRRANRRTEIYLDF
ncbi:OmpA family protein [Luteolibacter sp. AS25]|uniref:OmpA family protein n=1 Tax=Luteolibacter sp. AS25 TaxID=3135776 RepID=UPI00398A8B6E